MQENEPLPKILYEARTADDVGLQLRWDPPGIMDFPSLEQALVSLHPPGSPGQASLPARRPALLRDFRARRHRHHPRAYLHALADVRPQ
jgi:hypothetical protein